MKRRYLLPLAAAVSALVPSLIGSPSVALAEASSDAKDSTSADNLFQQAHQEAHFVITRGSVFAVSSDGQHVAHGSHASHSSHSSHSSHYSGSTGDSNSAGDSSSLGGSSSYPDTSTQPTIALPGNGSKLSGSVVEKECQAALAAQDYASMAQSCEQAANEWAAHRLSAANGSNEYYTAAYMQGNYAGFTAVAQTQSNRLSATNWARVCKSLFLDVIGNSSNPSLINDSRRQYNSFVSMFNRLGL